MSEWNLISASQVVFVSTAFYQKESWVTAQLADAFTSKFVLVFVALHGKFENKVENILNFSVCCQFIEL